MRCTCRLRAGQGGQLLVGLAFGLTFLARSTSGMMEINNPLYAQSLGATVSQVGLVTSVFFVTTTVLRLAYSARVDIAQLPSSIAFGFVATTGATVGVLISPNFLWLLGSVAIAGAGSALIKPHLPTLVAGLSSPEDRYKHLGQYATVLSTSLVVAPILGTVLLLRTSIRGVYVLLLALSLLAAVASVAGRGRLQGRIALIRANELPRGDTFVQLLRGLKRNVAYINSVLALTILGLAYTAALAFAGVYVKTRFRLPYSSVELLFVSFFTVSLFGRLAIAAVAGRRPGTRKLSWICSSLVVGAMGTFLMASQRSLVVFLIGFWMLAWPHAVILPLTLMRIAKSVTGAELVAANTLAYTFFDAAGALGPLLFGVIATRSSVQTGFWALGGMQVAGTVCIWARGSAERRDKCRTAKGPRAS